MKTLALAAILAIAAQGGKVIYRWTDGAGNVRASGSLSSVPEEFRAGAAEMKVVEMENSSMEAEKPAMARGSAKIEFPPGSGRIEAQAVFDGKAARMAIVDTGSDLVAITTKLARALGHSPAKSRKSWISTSSGRVLAPVITLKSVAMGGAIAADVPAVVMDFEGRGDVSAVIGMSFLSAFVFEIDASAGSMTLSAK